VGRDGSCRQEAAGTGARCQQQGQERREGSSVLELRRSPNLKAAEIQIHARRRSKASYLSLCAKKRQTLVRHMKKGSGVLSRLHALESEQQAGKQLEFWGTAEGKQSRELGRGVAQNRRTSSRGTNPVPRCRDWPVRDSRRGPFGNIEWMGKCAVGGDMTKRRVCEVHGGRWYSRGAGLEQRQRIHG
jgi:hypothetical protein